MHFSPRGLKRGRKEARRAGGGIGSGSGSGSGGGLGGLTRPALDPASFRNESASGRAGFHSAGSLARSAKSAGRGARSRCYM